MSIAIGRNPARVECRCGCLGVREFHEAGERVRRYMFVERPAALARMTVALGAISDRPGFGVSRNKKAAK